MLAQLGTLRCAMNDLMALTATVEAQYGGDTSSLQPLPSDSGKRLYCLQRKSGPPSLLRVTAATDDAGSPEALARVLGFLERQGYPAERLIMTVSGEPVGVMGGRWLLLTTFVAGAPPSLTLATLGRLGAALGRLHALPVAGAALPNARMLPEPELAYARGELDSVATLVPPDLCATHALLTAAVERLDHCEGLPAVLIHNDVHPGNALVLADGAVTLIDWEGSGLGPAVIDLGFLLTACDGGAPW